MINDKFHLLVVISHHGFGHTGMTLPLLRALRSTYPQLKVTLRTAVPEWFIRNTPGGEDVDLLGECVDMGPLMNEWFEVDALATFNAYRSFHSTWDQRVSAEANRLAQINPDLILSNIAYLPLAAAKQIEIPAIAYCCLNWADLFDYYCGDMSGAKLIHDQMRAAYADADLFLRPQPSMPMPDIATCPIGPVAAQVDCDRDLLTRRYDRPTRWVLASLGGAAGAINVEHWPRIDNLHYIVYNHVDTKRPDVHTLDSIGIRYSQAMACCDLLITKPGYGSFTEAACNGLPVLYVLRPDWPEQPYLCDWLARQVPTAQVTVQQLNEGDFAPALEALISTRRPSALPATGIRDALDLLAPYIK